MRFALGSRVRHIRTGLKGIVIGRADYEFETPASCVDFGATAHGAPKPGTWVHDAQLEAIDETPTPPEPPIPGPLGEEVTYASIVVDSARQAAEFYANLGVVMGDGVHGGPIHLSHLLLGDLSVLAPDQEADGRLRWREEAGYVEWVLRILGYADPDGYVTEKAKATGSV
jgi:hypothetical protein